MPSSNSDTRSITDLLLAWQSGDSNAFESLLPLVHSELERIAKYHLRFERQDHTLQTMGLVNEAYLRLATANLSVDSHSHLLAIASKLMRRVLVDHARNRSRHKRGGGLRLLTLRDSLPHGGDDNEDLIEVDDALNRLAEKDPNLSAALELVYFGGLTYNEAAKVLKVSRSKLGEDLQFAKAWLRVAMQPKS